MDPVAVLAIFSEIGVNSDLYFIGRQIAILIYLYFIGRQIAILI